jgi:hypothetical protein
VDLLVFKALKRASEGILAEERSLQTKFLVPFYWPSARRIYFAATSFLPKKLTTF